MNFLTHYSMIYGIDVGETFLFTFANVPEADYGSFVLAGVLLTLMIIYLMSKLREKIKKPIPGPTMLSTVKQSG
ncbi:MAG: hypothetical protein AAGA46_12725 [Cyanobacteria bacterium P01_F01_bin.13]